MATAPIRPHSIQLFATCLIQLFRPGSGMSAVRVLERLGLTVHYPEGQTCCGQPAFNAGFWDDARAMARHTIDLLQDSGDPIVVPSGSCAQMIIHYYPELFAGDPVYHPRALSLARRTYEFSQFLVDVVGTSRIEAHRPGRFTYHASCHLHRGLGITDQPQRLLAGLTGAELVELPGMTDCCGFGGLFSVKMADLSGAMLDRKLDAIEVSGAEIVVGCDTGCLLNIEGGLRRRGLRIKTLHLADVLATAELRPGNPLGGLFPGSETSSDPEKDGGG